MRVPTEIEALALMRDHGDYVETDKVYGKIYAFDRNGIRAMFDEWIDRMTPEQLPPPSLARKRQIAAMQAAADSEGGDHD